MIPNEGGWKKLLSVRGDDGASTHEVIVSHKLMQVFKDVLKCFNEEKAAPKHTDFEE